MFAACGIGGSSSVRAIRIANAAPLAPELDRAALVGWPVAQQLLDFDGHPTTVYERSRDEAVAAVQAVLAATANPENPDEVEVSRLRRMLNEMVAISTRPCGTIDVIVAATMRTKSSSSAS